MLWLVLALIIFIIQIGIILVLEYRRASNAVAWLFILFCVPIVGFAVYYLIAQGYRTRRKRRRIGSEQFQKMKSFVWDDLKIAASPADMSNPEFQHQERLFGLLSGISENPISGCNTTRVLRGGGETFTEMLEAMERAQHHIHIQFYIFRSDMIGERFKELMIRKAKAGVKVRMLCDGLGSLKLKPSFISMLKEAGVEFHFFLPPLVSLFGKRMNYRNHRKILVVDGTVGFMGGINVGDDYLGLYPKLGYWRDTHLRLEGDGVYFLQNTFLEDWYMASKQQLSGRELYPVHHCLGSEHVQILAGGPDVHWNAIQEMIFGAASSAKKRLWITTPYFIPDESVYTAIKTAAVSGVQVKIIIPYHSDNRLVHLASLSYVEDLLLAGVEFYQYAKGFMHAKVIIVDNLLATVGSANLDMRSFYYNFEMTALLLDQARIKDLANQFEEDLQDSRPIELRDFHNRSLWQKGAEMLARMLSPML